MHKIKINSKIYAQAHKENWLNSLAIFVLVAQNNKTFYFKPNQRIKRIKSISIKLGIGFTSLNIHLNILKEKGLVSFNTNCIKLITNKEMKVKSEKIIYIPGNVNQYSKIKLLLNSIPFLSKLYSQVKVIKKKEHFQYISNKVQSNKWLSKSEFRLYRSRIKKCNLESLKPNTKIIATINKVLECINRKSSATAVKYKQFLKEFAILDYQNSVEKLFSGVSQSFYIYLRRNDFTEYKNTFFSNGNIYKYNPTEYMIT